MGNGGGGHDTSYEMSHEQKKMLDAVYPMFRNLAQYGEQTYFGGAPMMGAPSMQGVLTSQPMYDIPDPTNMMPTSSWYNSLAPEVKAGLYAPYEEAGNQLMSTLNSRGQLGGAKGGISGAAGAGLGELAGQAAKNVGLSAWQMTAPAAQATWQAGLNRNINAFNIGQQERLTDFNTSMNVWNRPFSLINGIQGLLPQGIVTPSQNTFGNTVGGAAMGALGAYAGGMNPYVGAGLGAIGGYYG